MTSPGEFRVFISGVTSEVGKARDEIANDLSARGLLVKVQREFRQEADTETTLAKLDKYISECGAVVHIAGRRSGAFPNEEEARPYLHLLPAGAARASYTQWEFHLARAHKRRLSIYIAATDCKPDKDKPTNTDDDPALQAEHLQRLERLDRDYFDTTDALCRRVLREDWPVVMRRKPRNLPYSSLGSLFKGREKILGELHTALTDKAGGAAAIAGRALHGLGGIGKTRLAVEYALKYESDYTALLFVRAGTSGQLDASLAALAGPEILDLPEKDAREDSVKISAALGWLENHPGWLMILDNIDDTESVAAVGKLLARLNGGKVIVTGRVANFPASVRKLELRELDAQASVDFLLERTADDSVASTDDAKLAQELAGELGGLALGLEQAGAYIAAERIGFARYLTLWREKRAAVLKWFDKDLMSYDHDAGLAATWAASVDRLTPDARRLLERLAFLAPEPIPDSLLDVAVPGDSEEFDARGARSNLIAYSLVSRASVETGKTAQEGFSMHRLVQDFTRRGMSEERSGEALREALAWVNGAFMGNPANVRAWPLLDPVAAHALAAAEHGDRAGVAAPTADLYGKLDQLYDAKARYAEAERMSRRALAVDEASLGPDHPTVAIRLNNLAELLRVTNRPGEAEPLIRRALAIDEASHGPDHPYVAIRVNNLAELLRATNRLGEAEPLNRRALAIDEASYGPDHPNVANRLNNLALLLQATNRLGEAEPLMRRALGIDEASYGPDHPNVANRLNNLALLLHATSRHGEAEPLMRSALAIFETSYGPDHPSTVTVRSNLASLQAQPN